MKASVICCNDTMIAVYKLTARAPNDLILQRLDRLHSSQWQLRRKGMIDV